ncbi:MAG: (2Fe-2S)-binding protein [Firmicutes bacterium]|nr:(2Fe-2S)-binding protein [Bacillota bacterium]
MWEENGLRRITKHPILQFEEKPVITFTFEGRKLQGREGDTIASALHANGIKVLSHSRRYHRPRGFFCAIGKCSACLMTVNGTPNVRACVEPLVEGMDVRRQPATGGELKW